MKTLFFNPTVIGALIFMTMLTACQKEASGMEDNAAFYEATTAFKTLEKELDLGGDMKLPAGTQWRATNDELNEVAFKLPEGYTFLMENTETKATSKTSTAVLYACKCTGNGTSKIFVLNNEIGCLQNTCDDMSLGEHVVSRDGMTAVKVLRIEE